MSNVPMKLEPADVRRAGAWIAHNMNGNGDGAAAVLSEAVDAQRSVALLIAVTHLFLQLLPELRTPMGLEIVQSTILSMAALEST